MAQQQPPTITPVPTPPIQRGDRGTFSSRVDAFILWLVAAVAQFQALASNVYANALDAFASATAAVGARDVATGARDAAQAARDLAQGYRDTALQARNDAQSARDAAAASATAAATSALALIANSTTSNTLATGTKTFTVEANKQIGANQPMIAVSKSDATKYLYGQVTYSGTTLTMVVTAFSGTGSANDWTIAPTGLRGLQGQKGESGSGVPRIMLVTTSGPFVVPATDFEATLIGGGQAGEPNGGSGGNSAGVVIKRYSGLLGNEVASVIIGNGGASSTNLTARRGTASTFTINGQVSLIAGPGAATPGDATGGDINFPGQFGGNAAVSGTGVNGVDYTGGAGASTILGQGGPSTATGTGYGSAGGGSPSGNLLPGAGRPGILILKY